MNFLFLFPQDTIRSQGELGLSTHSGGELLAPDGTRLRRKFSSYSQSQAARRAKELDELEADGGKPLKEEMDFAAVKMAQNFIDHIKGKNSP